MTATLAAPTGTEDLVAVPAGLFSELLKQHRPLSSYVMYAAGPAAVAQPQQDDMIAVPAGLFQTLLGALGRQPISGTLPNPFPAAGAVAGRPQPGQHDPTAAPASLWTADWALQQPWFSKIIKELPPLPAAAGKPQQDDTVAVPAGILDSVLRELAKPKPPIGGLPRFITGLEPFMVVPAGAGQPQAEDMVAVPAGIFGSILGSIGGGLLGRVIGGSTGSDIGKAAGGALGAVLPFQVIPSS